ncbi:hypothetical protein ET475_04960 [Microbacterium protaetiae]|uniref:Uncharacterized protein n=1 Tax=Microbacterium protaetiae TaxID=2509458 RepID=A0A4P6EH31_9MICO|nr:hypothetical protein [Microbacterium protaetiae]QAY59407.1 hypothetical protein ET475_04960 [Microbacterium protaetiae]
MLQQAMIDETGWLRPVPGSGPREPRWGHADGMQIGLHPLGGPRGLIRIFTPYLDHPRDRLVNFIAVEPVPAGQTERGYSELEQSHLDDVPGLRFWSADDPSNPRPRDGDDPARGVVDGDTLTVSILSEPFANGADVWVTATFTRDRPHEVQVAAFARERSVPLETCVLTATMGNWARLRELELAGRTARASELWPDYRGIAFAPHASFGVDELVREGDEIVVRARPDEEDPVGAAYAEGTAEHWHYVGRRGAQEWRAADADPALRAQVNGRHTYWMSEHPLPGGIAFENVELVEPFRQGRAFTFRVEPL